MTTKRKAVKRTPAAKRAAKAKIAPPVVAPAKHTGKVLVLRTCTAEMRGTHQAGAHFTWPTSGYVEALDWNPEPVCGGGLHGLAWGDGDWSLLSEEPSAKWLVVEVDPDYMVKIDEQKVKFRCGEVVYCGTKAEAITRVLCGREAMDRHAIEKTAEIASGYGSTAASSGNYSTAASSGYGRIAASSGTCGRAASWP